MKLLRIVFTSSLSSVPSLNVKELEVNERPQTYAIIDEDTGTIKRILKKKELLTVDYFSSMKNAYLCRIYCKPEDKQKALNKIMTDFSNHIATLEAEVAAHKKALNGFSTSSNTN